MAMFEERWFLRMRLISLCSHGKLGNPGGLKVSLSSHGGGNGLMGQITTGR